MSSAVSTLDPSMIEKIRGDDTCPEISEAFLATVAKAAEGDGSSGDTGFDPSTAISELLERHGSLSVCVVELSDDAPLGRIQELHRSCTALYERLPTHGTRPSKSKIQDAFRALASNSATEDDIDDARNVLEYIATKGIKLGASPCWVFLEDDRDSMRTEMRGDLVCLAFRLGLPWLAAREPKLSGIEFLGVLLPRSMVDHIGRPSFFHAGFHQLEFWCPGGTTIPLPSTPPECESKGGLKELICEPPGFGDTEEWEFFVAVSEGADGRR